MNDELLADVVRRMVQKAAGYEADADFLNGRVGSRSDGAYLLELLAFEIRLKALLRIHRTQSHGHSYAKLFSRLPGETQVRVVRQAMDRMAGGADFSDVSGLLKTLGRNFVALRYAYEKYEDMSAEEVRELGDEWVAKGANTEDATFSYYPEELYGLNGALKREVDAWLSTFPRSPA
jgi:hypothetical protein